MTNKQTKQCSVEARLAIIGPYPPPYGGVSVHIERLRLLLLKAGLPFIVYNAGTRAEEADGTVVSVFKKRLLWMLYYLLFGSERAIYLHASRIATCLTCFWFAIVRRKMVLLCLHNSRQVDKLSRYVIGRCILRLTLSPANGIVCVNTHMIETLASIGLDRKKMHHFPAFLPPQSAPQYSGDLDASLLQFCREHSPLLSANGRVSWYEGTDLYGFDILLQLMQRLRDYPKAGLVICFYTCDDHDLEYIDVLREQALSLGIASRVLLWTETTTFIPVLSLSRVFLRPTNTDGDAVSIREALFLKVPVVASDVVERPKGTIVFRSRDIKDFECKVRSVLTCKCRHQSGPDSFRASIEDAVDKYVSLLAGITLCQREPHEAYPVI